MPRVRITRHRARSGYNVVPKRSLNRLRKHFKRSRVCRGDGTRGAGLIHGERNVSERRRSARHAVSIDGQSVGFADVLYDSQIRFRDLVNC